MSYGAQVVAHRAAVHGEEVRCTGCGAQGIVHRDGLW